MNVKIDTRASYHAITIQEKSIAANMTAELRNSLLSLLQNDVKSAVVIMKDIQNIDNAAASCLLDVQQAFYQSNASFVLCELPGSLQKELKQNELMDLLNYAATESQAVDIVHLEQVERELWNES